MKKKVTITICDICGEDESSVDGFTDCDICKKEVCEDCVTEFELVQDNDIFPVIMICQSCIHHDDVQKELKKFFKQKNIKEQLNNIRIQLKDYVVKLAMVNALENKKSNHKDL